ncbi:50S ribosomal protein L4 [Candidatus Synchoanobacter obligatus]|uniref:Large ribosomal subunit protein uL4 n=1 Tax=Candidatus Synchoanobacter obligatus TaxID=2919597 RepID=A0ABT1L5R3_9GAMM|nr:50S ribosomal protein L4 [Candidatus Synchoanobacter obligatus]MCP8352487.1 50S ribosomal protein L4 [Candidatus Synchoanobacter obligatus]
MKVAMQDNKKSSVDFSPSVFGVDTNPTVVWKVITIYTKKRITTSANKSRSDVAFSGKKPWQQKGLGRARAGTKASPIWRKGGVTFAKTSIDYRSKYKINKKEYRQAIRVMLSDHMREGRIKLVSELNVTEAKTKSFKQLMTGLDFVKAGKPNNWTGLIIVGDLSESMYLASSNLYEYMLTDVRSLDPLSLKHASELLITREALKQIEEWLS